MTDTPTSTVNREQPSTHNEPRTLRIPLPLLGACGCGSGCSCGCQSGGSCSCGGNCG